MKPEIIFDSFSVSTNIANTCEKEMNAALFDCGVETSSGMTLFVLEANGCFIKVEDTQENGDGFCYHVPIEDANMFTS